MRPLIRSQPWDVRQRLEALCHVGPTLFETAVLTGHVALLQCTDNDPPFIPGTAAWWRTLRSLREQLLGAGSGWRKDDTGNYSLTINDDHRVSIVVASGDEMTGLIHGDDPKTKAPKGIRTENRVEQNAQGDLFPHLLKRPSNPGLFDLWVLLIHIKPEEIRAELSRPITMEDHHITGWSERIILPINKEDPERVRISPDDFGPDFDPEVRRVA